LIVRLIAELPHGRSHITPADITVVWSQTVPHGNDGSAVPAVRQVPQEDDFTPPANVAVEDSA